MLLGLERVTAPEFAELQRCVHAWQTGWGLTLTTCFRLEDPRDAFVLIAERTYTEALTHLHECLRTHFPDHVIVARSYVQGAHLPLFTLDEAGFERLRRVENRTAAIVREARAGRRSPLLPERPPGQSAVAAWRERNHVVPSGQGTYLLCDACGETTERHATDDELWTQVQQGGWRVYRAQNVCFCPTCLQNGNAAPLERLVMKIGAPPSLPLGATIKSPTRGSALES